MQKASYQDSAHDPEPVPMGVWLKDVVEKSGGRPSLVTYVTEAWPEANAYWQVHLQDPFGTIITVWPRADVGGWRLRDFGHAYRALGPFAPDGEGGLSGQAPISAHDKNIFMWAPPGYPELESALKALLVELEACARLRRRQQGGRSARKKGPPSGDGTGTHSSPKTQREPEPA